MVQFCAWCLNPNAPCPECHPNGQIEHEPLKPPPIGIMPRFIHDQRRAIELIEAIERYRAFHNVFPKEWTDELMEYVESH